jgi:REP element-mobilizing transposase RayT
LETEGLQTLVWLVGVTFMAPEILPERKNLRLANYNYSKDGYYFVTICTYNKKPFCKQFENIILLTLETLPVRFCGLKLDYHVIMPTHIHLILTFNKMTKTLGEVIRTFKALVTKESNKKHFWQRGYYEHVIRNEKALLKIRTYIQNNPLVEKLNLTEVYKTGLDKSSPYKRNYRKLKKGD